MNAPVGQCRAVKCDRRGAVVIYLAISLPIILLICAFAMNIAYIHLSRAELRSANDSAARAAASVLSQTGDQDAAAAAAVTVAGQNTVGGETYVLPTEDVEFGKSDRASTNDRFEFATPGVGDTVNAVRIEGHGPSVGLLFAPLLGQAAFTPIQESVATFSDVDICLVLDRSSSMKLSTDDTAGTISSSDARFCDVPWSDSRWQALSTAVAEFIAIIDSTERDEYVALVTYASDYTSCDETTSNETDINVQLTPSSSQITSAMSTLSSTLWNGMTNIDAGIDRAVEVLTDPTHSRSHANKVMIVLTDGVYTGSDPVPSATAAASADVIVHTITFSAGANQTDMQDVATAGGGNHYHAPDAATLNEVFREVAVMAVLITE